MEYFFFLSFILKTCLCYCVVFGHKRRTNLQKLRVALTFDLARNVILSNSIHASIIDDLFIEETCLYLNHFIAFSRTRIKIKVYFHKSVVIHDNGVLLTDKTVLYLSQFNVSFSDFNQNQCLWQKINRMLFTNKQEPSLPSSNIKPKGLATCPLIQSRDLECSFIAILIWNLISTVHSFVPFGWDRRVNFEQIRCVEKSIHFEMLKRKAVISNAVKKQKLQFSTHCTFVVSMLGHADNLGANLVVQ